MLYPGFMSPWLYMLSDCCVQTATTKLTGYPNAAIPNCWFMMDEQGPVSRSSQCASANELFIHYTLTQQQVKKHVFFFHPCQRDSSSPAYPSPNQNLKPHWRHSPPQPTISYSIMEGSLVSRIWSVRIQGMDISMGNWMRRPIVSSRKNSRNQSWDRSQHCCSASATQRDPPVEGLRSHPRMERKLHS